MRPLRNGESALAKRKAGRKPTEAKQAFSEIDAHVTQSEIKRVELEQEISNLNQK